VPHRRRGCRFHGKGSIFRWEACLAMQLTNLVVLAENSIAGGEGELC
jgi:hypothetical protein